MTLLHRLFSASLLALLASAAAQTASAQCATVYSNIASDGAGNVHAWTILTDNYTNIGSGCAPPLWVTYGFRHTYSTSVTITSPSHRTVTNTGSGSQLGGSATGTVRTDAYLPISGEAGTFTDSGGDTIVCSVAGAFFFGSFTLYFTPPPVISGIQVNGVVSTVIPAGTSGYLSIYGQFLNNPSAVNFSGTGITITNFQYYSTGGNGAGQINAFFQASPSVYGTQNVTVQTDHGVSNASPVDAAPVAMRLSFIGNTVINALGQYSEDTSIAVTAVRADSGMTMPSFSGTVNIAELGVKPIYTQNGGSLPASVNLPTGGTTSFTAKSLANPQSTGASGAPPLDAQIKTTNYPVYGAAYISVPQWIISGARIDTHSTGSVPDWLQTMTRDIFNGASGDLAAVIASIGSYDVKAMSYAGLTRWVRGSKSPVDINPYYNAARTNSAGSGGCGFADHKWITNTLAHEGRHAYHAIRAAQDDTDGDFLLVKDMPIAPPSLIIDSTTSRQVCYGSLHPISLAYHGDMSFDQPYSPDNASYAWEMDAWTFAASHDQ